MIFFIILGGSGEVYVESRGAEVSWRPHHAGYMYNKEKTMDNKFFVCENINIFGYWGGGGGGLQ